LPTTRKRVSTRKPRNLKAGSSRKTQPRPAASHKKPSHRRSGAEIVHHKALNEEPYVYECTRPGCGYRIWRDDKAGEGEHRFDLKCPKCHNKEFRCLGKGDVPKTFEASIPISTLDFDNMNPIDLGTN
jgi:hypothetical protein